ncbi:hypothetical protein ACTA71_012444 [Dictyostelium dimigraforme]
MVKIATRSSTKLLKRKRVQLFDLHELLYSPLPRVNKKVKKTSLQKSKSKYLVQKLNIKPLISTNTSINNIQQQQQQKQQQQQPIFIPTLSTSIYRLVESNSIVNGSSIWENSNSMVLTNSTTDKIGSCYYNRPIDFENKSWINEFSYSVETNGTDGLTFLLYKSIDQSSTPYEHYKLLEGGQLEYNDDHLKSAKGGILAIEFKTSLNDNIQLPNSNQIIIKTPNPNNSNLLTNVIHSHSMNNSSIINNTNSVKIEYNHSTSSITIIFNSQILLTNIVIPSKTIPNFAYFGYTAATGYCIQKQTINNLIIYPKLNFILRNLDNKNDNNNNNNIDNYIIILYWQPKLPDSFVTGASVNLHYGKGVVMGSDMLLSYESLERFNSTYGMKICGEWRFSINYKYSQFSYLDSNNINRYYQYGKIQLIRLDNVIVMDSNFENKKKMVQMFNILYNSNDQLSTPYRDITNN